MSKKATQTKLKIAHIINPVAIGEESDLFFAQDVTFASMIKAKEMAAGSVDVELYSAQYVEDHVRVHPEFNKTPDLERSIMDFGPFEDYRKLPLIADILDRLYESAIDADYMIYTNVDIALQPEFYLEVQKLILEGYDTFTINRRTISDRFKSLDELPEMLEDAKYASLPHPGTDCFVFPRAIYPDFILENACIGVVEIGKTIVANMIMLGSVYHKFENLHLTFHIGNDGAHRRVHLDQRLHNAKQLQNIETAWLEVILKSHFSTDVGSKLERTSARYKSKIFSKHLIHSAAMVAGMHNKLDSKVRKARNKTIEHEEQISKLLSDLHRLRKFGKLRSDVRKFFSLRRRR